MAVVIKGMQMPANCGGCIFGHPLNNNECYCVLHPTEKPTGYADGRPEHCPLRDLRTECDKYKAQVRHEVIKDIKSVKEKIKSHPASMYIGPIEHRGLDVGLITLDDIVKKEYSK